ncbi:LuxR C-terminal-related transcriptional regulator [Actinacidiphila sp. bgisy145]|uniref:helix-turn-helix transcriptional regulator n=1 Tax=Actinacidiphila sp. bgisy145 TaxID=3413792 RepID=UPI003EBC3FCD
MPDEEDQALAVYEALRRLGSAVQSDLGTASGLDTRQAAAALRRLTEIGLVEERGDGHIESVDPDTALVRTLEAYHTAAKEQSRRTEALRDVSQALLYVYRPAVERVASKVQVEYIRDRWSKHRVLDALTETIQRTSDSLHPGPMPPADVLESSLKRDAQLIKRGVRLRAIYPLSMVQTPRHLRYLQEAADLGVSVRLLDHAPCDILLHDNELACMPSNPHAVYDNPMLLIRSTDLVQTLTAVFDDYWLRAATVEQALRDERGAGAVAGRSPELTAQERVVIRLMSTGLSDEQIARKVGVHRRTVQRVIAKLMERLGAGSRFEAGLKLAQDPALMRAIAPNRFRATGHPPAAAPGQPPA